MNRFHNLAPNPTPPPHTHNNGTVELNSETHGNFVHFTLKHRACLAKICTEQNNGLLILELVKSNDVI